MITKFKLFERSIFQTEEPQVGDYVKLHSDDMDSSVCDFLDTHIGKLVKIDDSEFPYSVEFEEVVPLNKDSKIMNFERDEIVDWAYDKDLFDIKNDAGKYNI